jgi:hypothetical protein
MTRVEIVVDELVVRGLNPEAARAAAEALESRLWMLARADGQLAARTESFLRLPPLEPPPETPAALGEAVARAVWGALSRERSARGAA